MYNNYVLRDHSGFLDSDQMSGHRTLGKGQHLVISRHVLSYMPII